MIEGLAELIREDAAVTWREIARLLLLSIVFTFFASRLFVHNAPSRRVMLLGAMLVLAVLPWLAASYIGVWRLPVAELPGIDLASAVPQALVWVWFGVAAVLLIVHSAPVVREARHIRALPRLLDSSETPVRRADAGDERCAPEDLLCSELTFLCTDLECARPVVRLGDQACATTLGRETIVLPPEWSIWTTTTLRCVLAHELIHIQRRDDRWLLLARGLVIAYWWMPWLGVLWRACARAVEESCDDAASELSGAHAGYAHALLAAVPRSAVQSTGATLGMHRHPLVHRVGRFSLQRMLELDTRGVYWSVVLVLLGVVTLTAVQPVPEADPMAHRAAGPSLALVSWPNPSLVSGTPVGVTVPGVRDALVLPAALDNPTRRRVLQPVYAPRPIYPGAAMLAGVEGDVRVAFSIGRDGRVLNAQVTADTAAGQFNDAALQAVRATRYAPDYRTGSKFSRDAIAGVRSHHQPPLTFERSFRFRLRQEI